MMSSTGNGTLDTMNVGAAAAHLSIDSALEHNITTQVASPYESTPGSWENEIHVQLPITPPQPTTALGPPLFRFPPSPPSPPTRVLIDDLMRADL